MIEKQTRPSFNHSILLSVILLSVLVLLFVFAIVTKPGYLAFGLLIIILYLIPLQKHIARKYSDTHLQTLNLQEKRNLVEVEIKKEEATIKSFKDKIADFSDLKGLTEKLSMSLSLSDTSKTLSAEGNKLFGDKATTIILYHFQSKTGQLGISSSQQGQMRINIKSKKGDVFDQWLMKSMQPLLIEDTHRDYRFDMEKVAEQTRSIRSIISVPFMAGNKALGLLRIDSPRPGRFNTGDLRLLMTIGDLGAVATENAQLYEYVEQLAIKDSLTKLYLRNYLMDRIPGEISRQIHRKTELIFMMIDLDYFKKYNDKFGHTAGDIVLRTVGSLLMDFFNQPGNLVCRYGGEEFCVLLPDSSKLKAKKLAEALRETIEQQGILLRLEKTCVTVSIGVASFPKDAQTKEKLLHKADQMLYKAKEQGRNQVCMA